MGPSNEHELEIAREVDKHSEHNDLSPHTAPEIMAFLDFRMTNSDAEFLRRYIQWRMEHPIVK